MGRSHLEVSRLQRVLVASLARPGWGGWCRPRFCLVCPDLIRPGRIGVLGPSGVRAFGGACGRSSVSLLSHRGGVLVCRSLPVRVRGGGSGGRCPARPSVGLFRWAVESAACRRRLVFRWPAWCPVFWVLFGRASFLSLGARYRALAGPGGPGQTWWLLGWAGLVLWIARISCG